jgi:TPR repeat protein
LKGHKINLKDGFATFLLTVLVSIPVHAVGATPEWCEAQWRTESVSIDRVDTDDQGARKFSDLLERWKSYEKDCSGTIVFECRLASAYILANQYDKARQLLKSVEQKRSKYHYLVEFILLQIDYFSVYREINVSKDYVISVKEKFLDFVRKYPNFPDAYGQLGGLQSLLNEHEAAIKSLEFARNSSMSLLGVYRNLAISYEAVGRHEDAHQAADKAYQLNKSVTSDQYFVYAVAKADAGLGDFESAELVLRVIAAKKPEVRRNPDFKDTVDFVLARKNAGGAKAQYEQAVASIEGDEGEYPAKVLHGIELLKKSAEQGYAPAQFKLGFYYHTGQFSYDCLKQEPQQAYYWYEKAAEQSYPEAQYELAMLFNPEIGFKKFTDHSKYLYWMKRAADAGFPKAQYWLGRMYETGDSVQQDLKAARLLYEKAASKEDRLAIKALKRLRKDTQ